MECTIGLPKTQQVTQASWAHNVNRVHCNDGLTRAHNGLQRSASTSLPNSSEQRVKGASRLWAHNAFQQITALGLPDSSTQHVTRASRAHNACQQSSLQSTGLHGLIMLFDQKMLLDVVNVS